MLFCCRGASDHLVVLWTRDDHTHRLLSFALWVRVIVLVFGGRGGGAGTGGGGSDGDDSGGCFELKHMRRMLVQVHARRPDHGALPWPLVSQQMSGEVVEGKP